jgi:tRNA G26 N,N-dimethylase Trm1
MDMYLYLFIIQAFQCENCQNRTIIPIAYKEKKKKSNVTKFKFNNLNNNETCDLCESKMGMYGPFWIDEIHDYDFIDSLQVETGNSQLKFKDRINTMFLAMKDELPVKNQVFSYDYSRLFKEIHLSCPKMSLIK